MLVALLTSLSVLSAGAQDFEYQGIWYRSLTETTAEVALQYSHGRLEGDVVIPEYVENEGRKLLVTGISNSAFAYTHITSFTLDRAIDFSSSVFSGCRLLGKVKLPEGMTQLPSNTFYGCTALVSIQLPSTLTLIDVAAFAGCESLTSIDIPVSVTTIEGSAFSGCSQLERVTMGDAVTSLSDYCFQHCTLLKDIHIPQQLESVEMECFLGCSSLQRLNFPATTKRVGSEAFMNCTALQEVTLSDGIETISDNTFSGCTSLKNFQMPSTVKTIGFRAFNESGLERITLPAGIQQIESAAFNCQNLVEVNMKNPMMGAEWPYYIRSDAFSKPVLYFATLRVPEGSKAYYRTQDVWKDFQNIVEENISGCEYCDVQVQATGYSTVKVNDAVVDVLLSPSWMSVEKGQPLKLTVLLDEGSTVYGSTRYLASVKVNGQEMLSQMSVDGNVYELALDAVNEDLDILVDLPWRSYAVTVQQAEGGALYVIPASKTRMDVKVTAADGCRISKIDDNSSFWRISESRDHDGKNGVVHFTGQEADDHQITVTFRKE